MKRHLFAVILVALVVAPIIRASYAECSKPGNSVSKYLKEAKHESKDFTVNPGGELKLNLKSIFLFDSETFEVQITFTLQSLYILLKNWLYLLALPIKT